MSLAPAQATILVGVMVERTKAASQWIDFIWKPLTVLAGQPDTVPWTQVSANGDTVTFYAGPAEIALYRTDTATYRDNLASGAPRLWVALRPTGVEPPLEIFAVTADPAEGEALTETTGDLVDVVTMPQMVREVVEAFVAEHHIERPFMKRQRDSADPQTLARRSPPAEERDP